jgi:hypothetical protein
MMGLKLSHFAEERPAVLVVSHLRSGTHFLMNALANCYGYVSSPWYNLDPINTHLNFYDPPCLVQFLLDLASRPMANVVKSHHMVEYFAGELPRLTRRYVVFYIYRDPVAVLLSCWRFMHRWPWVGPCVADPLTFARSEPSGALLRYQLRQYPALVRLWAAHVEGWLAAAKANSGITLVRYEDLDTHFERTLRGLGRVLGRPPQALTRPAREEHVIPGGPQDPTGLGVPPDTTALSQFCRETVGDTMARLGY